MNKLILSLPLLALTTVSALAQRFPKEASIWYFGNKAGLKFVEGQVFPTALSDATLLDAPEGTTTLCDTAGTLQFYVGSAGIATNAQSTVFNRNHVAMENGEDIIGGSSSTQNGIVQKRPGSNSVYYLFTVAQQENTLSHGKGFYYSVVDMAANGGLGWVDPAQKNVMIVDSITEKVSATLHRNGQDIWILSHRWRTNEFVAVRLSAAGVSAPVITRIGIDHQFVRGALKLSPNGNMFACALTEGQNIAGTGSGKAHFVQLGRFNNLTGEVESVFHIKLNDGNGFGPYGVEFSPDNSKLYVGDRKGIRILQYNMLAGADSAAIIASEYEISTGTGTGSYTPGSLQTGPDGRIYVSKTGGASGGYLACITLPNRADSACDHWNNFVQLAPGTSCDRGLANIPMNFFNGLLAMPVANKKLVAQQVLTVRKTRTEAIATLPKGFSGGSIRVLNASGMAARASSVSHGESEARISIEGLAAGVYVVQVLGREEGQLQARIVVE